MHYFITNREILTDKNGKEYIREDGHEKAFATDNLRFGEAIIEENGCEFQLFPDAEIGKHISYSGLKNENLESLKGSAKFFKLIYDSLFRVDGEKGDVLFFVHGFNTDLDGVRENFQMLKKKYVTPESPIKHIVIFTWPGKSWDLPLHYHNDKNDAIRSGMALGRSFGKLIEFFQRFLIEDRNKACNGKIHLMLHSMGHRVFKHAMLELKEQGVNSIQLFQEIICMAGDVNYKIFESGNAFEDLIDFGDRVHIYFHGNDKVLDISKYTKNLSNRLGRYGRRKADSSSLDIIDVDVSHCTDDSDFGMREDWFNHWYYYSSSKVVQDVVGVLNGKNSEMT